MLICKISEQFEKSPPPNVCGKTLVPVEREPYQGRLSDHVVLRDESPVPGVERVVPVVSHHKVIILFEGVGLTLFAVYENFSRLTDFQIVAFVGSDNPFVKRQIFKVETDFSSL